VADHSVGTQAAVTARAAVTSLDGEPVLLADRISKHWPGQKAPTLDAIELAVDAGEVVAILGANGAGKTTLLRVLAAIIEPDDGVVLLPRREISPTRNRREYHRLIGLLPPGDRGLYARMTVTAHLDLWARLALLDSRTRTEATERVIAAFALEPLSLQRVDRLSMGQRQRLRAALAFLHEPELLLLDEPTSSLDEEGVDLLRRALGEVLRRGGACVWVGPQGMPGGLASDRTLLLRDGGLIDP
jgi:ABC-type multidrug transport system ATPase subunit